jgi:FMN phosphatase YigB (HAD superfamily)
MDGTLFWLPWVQVFMFAEICVSLLSGSLRLNELLIIRDYRLVRERISQIGLPLSRVWREVADSNKVSVGFVEDLVEVWMHNKPLKYVRIFRRRRLLKLIQKLAKSRVQLAFWSDNRLAAKMKALGLEGLFAVCSEDPDVEFGKPNSKGLLKCTVWFGVNPGDALLVGDRRDKDGLAAQNLGSSFVLAKGRFIRKVRDFAEK